MGKRRKGRAAKAARYRSAIEGSTPSRGSRQTQHGAPKWTNKTQSQPRQAANHGQLRSHHLLPLTLLTWNLGFSLADEARNTAHNHAGADQVRKLRGLPVTFVSAGMIEPLKQLEELGLVPAGDDGGLDSAVEKSPPEGEEADEEEEDDNEEEEEKEEAAREGDDESPTFFVDTTGDNSLARRHYPQARIRSPSPDLPGESSDSGEDIVLFKGRKAVPAPEPQPVAVDQMVIEVQRVEETIQSMSLVSANEARPPKSPSTSPKPWQLRGYDDDEDLIADYMANMADDDDDNDDNDDDEAGAQDGQRAKDLLHSTFSATRDLGGFEGDFVLQSEESHSNNSVTSENEDDESDDGGDDDNDGEASGTLNVRDVDLDAFSDTEYMDDEGLARLLAKQEELGIDDEELVLFSSEGFEVLPSSNKQRKARLRGKSATTASKGHACGFAPSASVIADVFDELDLMDWDRHNPPRKSKSKRGLPDLEHLDPEIAATLEATWQKDRLRKKERRQAREELRAQGLLGKNADPNDLRQKYQTGMTLDQIKEEMRNFLQGEAEL